MSDACRICGRSAKDAFACTVCAQSARDNLTNIASLAGHLDSKRAHERSNWTTGTIGRAAVLPLPYDPRVSAVADPIRIGLHGSVLLCGDTRPADDSIATVARWLVARCDWIRRRDFGPDEFGTFERAKDALVQLFDNPPAQLYVGRCGAIRDDLAKCPASLYVEADDDGKPASQFIACPLCLTVHPLGLRQSILAAGVADYLGTSHEISQLCRHMLGDDVSPAMIRGYAHRGTIAAKGTRVVDTKAGHRTADLYRIGDVQAAAANAREREAVRHELQNEARRRARLAALAGR